MSENPGRPSSEGSARRFYSRLSAALTQNPNTIIALFGIYYLIQIVVRLATPPALRIDEAQQVLFAQWLALGYDAQPPLYNWFQQALFGLFGTSLATLAIAKSIILLLIFAVYVRLADLVLKDKRLVLVAAFALFLSPQVFWQAQRDLTHTTMLMLTCTWLLYLTIRLIQKPSTTGYALVGLAVGLGMLSKYNFVLILPAILVAVWFHPEGRKRLLDKRLLLAIAISLLVFLPHAIWLLTNLQFASEVTLKRMAEEAPDSRFMQIVMGLARVLYGSIVTFIVPIVLLGLFLRKSRTSQPAPAQAPWLGFFARYFMTLALVLIAVILATTMTEVRDRWLVPLLMPLPIGLALLIEKSSFDRERLVQAILPTSLAAMIVLPLVLVLSVPVSALAGKTSRSNYDWQAFADHIRTQGISPSLIVTPDWPTGGNMRFVFPQTTVATVIYDDFDPPFQVSNDHPVLFAWPGSGNDTAEMVAWIKEQIGVTLKDVSVKTYEGPMYYPVKGSLQVFSYATITPANFVEAQSAP